MKIYLSGPMRGIPDLNKPAFAFYADYLRGQGHEVFNPAAANLESWPIRKIFAYELEWLCMEADAIALMPGFHQSKGARAELAAAEAVGIEVIRL